MTKAVALCCILLPLVCYAACTAGTDKCDLLDEAALIQKDLLLAQNSLDPTDIDTNTVAKHVSEALSLQYLAESNNAKLKMMKGFQEEFKPIGDQILAATDEYHKSEHSEEGFENWYAAVSEGLSKTVSSTASSVKAAEAEAAKANEGVIADLDNMEEGFTFADKVTKLASAQSRSVDGSMVAGMVKDQNKHVMKAMEAYEENTKDGFKDQEFAKTLSVISMAVSSIKSNFDMWVQMEEKKVKDVEDASLKFKQHSPANLNDAVWQLVAVDKASSRSELSTGFQKEWPVHKENIFGQLSVYSASERSQADFVKFRTGVSEVLDKVESMMSKEHDLDVDAQRETKASLVASLNNLGDEGEFAEKLTKFSRVWGKQRMEIDIMGPVLGEKAKITKAMKTFEDNTKDGFNDKEFGNMYPVLVKGVLGIEEQFNQWAGVSKFAVEKLKKDNSKTLGLFTKQ